MMQPGMMQPGMMQATGGAQPAAGGNFTFASDGRIVW
jgi:hypothetical protein